MISFVYCDWYNIGKYIIIKFVLRFREGGSNYFDVDNILGCLVVILICLYLCFSVY